VRTSLNNFVLGANVENLRVIGIAGLAAAGNDLSNFLRGNDGKDDLSGGKGNDSLDGGAGSDTLRGGLGNDTYFIDDLANVVEEADGAGNDTVRSTVDFAIGAASIETLLLFSDNSAISGTGNDQANVITAAGTSSAQLFGGGGNDTMTGGGGNDVLIGDDGNDVMNGGAGLDALNGGIGNDILTGGDGRDQLDGGSGNDIMSGGKDDDVYFVDQTGDKITELANQGRDLVISFAAKFTLGPNLEDLILGDGAVEGIGNTLANDIVGSAENNTIDGGAGDDELDGRDGLDTLLGGAGNDGLFGDADDDLLKGGTGNDILGGGTGADILFGEAGSDRFLYAIESEGELPDLGGDTINGFQSGVDKIDISQLLGFFDVELTDAFANQHVLFGKVGADTLLQFDSDGAGGVGPVTLATITNATLVQGDFILISDNPL
jgi:Ca2+-binding RTX toxin-like protein